MTSLDKIIEFQSEQDDTLLKKIKSNDRKSFEAIFFKYNEVLFEHAYRILHDREVCMDIVQEIFVWLWTNREILEINSLKPYLLAAVKFQVANYMRRNKIQSSYLSHLEYVLSNSPVIEFHAEVKEMKDLIQHLIELLPEKCRHVFILSRQEFLSNKEIALKLNISEKTVEMHITLALKRLRVGLRDYMHLLLLLY